MFTSNINTKMFYKKIHDTNNRWTLMKLEKQIDEYLEKYEKQLEDEMVEDLLDIRDTIITRLSQLRREEMMLTYLDEPLPKIIIPTIEEQENQNKEQNKYYKDLLQKKNQLEAELQKINKELEKVIQIPQ
jgi:paraquat-inducible protein B